MAASKEFSLLTKLTLSAAGFNAGIEQAKKKTNDLAKGTEVASNQIKGSFGKLASLGSGLTSGLAPLQGVIMGGVSAFKAMIPALNGVKGALISTGIGIAIIAISLAFAALTSYLGGSSEGSKKLKEQFAYVAGAITVILNRLKFLGKALYQVFTGDFKAAGESLEKAFKSGFTDEIIEAGKEANEREKEKNRLGKERMQYLHYEADTDAKINKLRADAMNKDELDIQSLKEKRDLLKQAEDLAIQKNERKVKLLTEEWQLADNVLKAKGLSATKEDKEDELAKYQALRAAESELSIMRKDISKQEFKLNQSINKLEKEEKNKAAEEEQQQQENLLNLTSINNELKLASDKNLSENKRQLLQNEVNEWVNKENEKLDKIEAVTDFEIEEKKRLKSEIDKIAGEKLKKGNEKLDNEELIKSIETKKQANDYEITLLNEKLDNNLISQKNYNDKLNQLTKNQNDLELNELETKHKLGEISEENYQLALKKIRDKANISQEIANKDVWQKITDNYTSAAGQTKLYEGVINSLGDSLVSLATDGKTSFKGLVLSMLAGLRQIINGLLAQAIAGQIATNSKFGIPGLVMAMVGVAGVEALFASLPAFNNGGIVNGNSYSGDKVLARVNSGELILNQKQQSRLFDLANNSDNNYNSNNNYNNVSFRISGNDLVGVLERFNKKNQNFR